MRAQAQAKQRTSQQPKEIVKHIKENILCNSFVNRNIAVAVFKDKVVKSIQFYSSHQTFANNEFPALKAILANSYSKTDCLKCHVVFILYWISRVHVSRR